MQYKIDIEIPDFLIIKNEEDKHNNINFDLIEGKVIIGLCGYSKSGKDFIANKFIKNYGYHRIAFADNVKKIMNNFLKEKVFDYIKSEKSEYPELSGGVNLSDGRVLTFSDIDFLTEDFVVKNKLRPFIVWFGETIRELNGGYYWINKAFESDSIGFDKIVLSDIRRPLELDIFKNSNTFNKRTEIGFGEVNYFPNNTHKINSYGSLFFHVNQFGLKDTDLLTQQTIREAQENWMFDDVFYIDSRLPTESKFRDLDLNNKIKNISKKFNIQIENKKIKNNQKSIFD